MKTVHELVLEGISVGEPRGDVPADVVSEHVARSFEAAMRDWATRRVDDAPRLVRLLLDVAMGGVRSQTETASPPPDPRPRPR